MDEVVRKVLRQVPGLVKAVRSARGALSLAGAVVSRWALSAPGLVIYNRPMMWVAESYLRRYYGHQTRHLGEDQKRHREWFDHRADLYCWAERRLPFWVERGVFSREVMFQGCRVLDLCCGDGFYSYYFYSGTAAHIDAVDQDPSAIAHARKWLEHPRISYLSLDIVREDFPESGYDVITWDGAIEYFSEDQIRTILAKCVRALKMHNGILNGYAVIPHHVGANPDHQHEFRSVEELKSLLREYFPAVGMLETEYPERYNVYFRGAFDPARLRRFV